MAEEHRHTTDLQAVFEETKEYPDPGRLSAEQTAQIIRVVQSSISHSGPLPSPVMLEGYERVLPGSGERLLLMAERQSEHRQQMERAVILGGVKAQARGVICAFILAFAGISFGFVLGLYGHGPAGFGIFLTSLAALVGTFIFGRVDQRKEREGKQEPDGNEQG